VTIPSSVTSIGGSAFLTDTGLTSVTIPSSVTSIGANAFQGDTGLTSVTIPSSVTSTNGSEFYNDTGLTSVTLQNSVTSPNEFQNDSHLTTLSLGSTLTLINTQTFENDPDLSSVTIPSSVTSIDNYAFETDTGLTSVNIPSSVTSIGGSAFYGDSMLATVTIPSSVTTIGQAAFDDDPVLTSVTIPSSVTSVGIYAFSGDTSLTTVTIQNAVVAQFEFEDDTALTSIAINGAVTAINSYAFSGDTALQTITIPSSVTSFGSDAFNGDTLLTNVYFLGNAPTFGSANFTTAGYLYHFPNKTGWNLVAATAVSPLVLTNYYVDAYSYNTNGGSTAPASGSGNDGSTIALASAPTQSGYTFAGWSDGTSTYAAGATYTLSSGGASIVFTAQWTSNAPQYVMDYFSYSDPSLGVVPQNGIGIDNTPITLAAAPARSGYTFAGWSDGTNTYAAGSSYTLQSAGNAITLTAEWAPIVTTTPPTAPAAPTLTSLVGTKNGLVATFSPSDQTATSYVCKVSNGKDVFVRTATMTQTAGQSSYVCSFTALNAAQRYRVWVTAVNQYGSSTFASTTAVTQR
jgi:uncharacterized repeat protein (TIGR02543 family)